MKKQILVAPLCWGLGHATRCIPIINTLIKQDFTPIIASDGEALHLLQKEFPKLQSITLPSYDIKYPKNGKSFYWNLIKQFPKIKKAIKNEKKHIDTWLKNNSVVGIISDNRYGIYNNQIPSVIITHQLRVFSGITTKVSTFFQQQLLQNFTECWVPDTAGLPNLSANLAHNINASIPVKFIGSLSRFKKKEMQFKHDVLVLISGPEPQRSSFEDKMFHAFKDFKGSVVFICGKITNIQKINKSGSFTYYNFALTNQLEQLLNESKWVVSRSGYSTIMDLQALEKKAFFIPTKGQFEQEYLAIHLKKMNIAPFISEEKFTTDSLLDMASYSGFQKTDMIGFTDLFGFFKSK